MPKDKIDRYLEDIKSKEGKIVPEDRNPKKSIGIALPFGNFPNLFEKNFTSEEQAKTNLKSLLMTTKGERFYNPELGTDLKRFLFEPITDDLPDRIEADIESTINFWLPYIDILKNEVIIQEDEYQIVSFLDYKFNQNNDNINKRIKTFVSINDIIVEE